LAKLRNVSNNEV